MHRLTRIARRLGVAAVSVGVLVAAAAFVASPAVETISARLIVSDAAVGRESIGGQVLERGRPASATTVTIYRRLSDRRDLRLGTRGLDPHGRFSFREPVGRYIVVLRRRAKTLRIAITLARGKTVFVKVTVKVSGAFALAPVIFNY
jgi:hypothetical protein